MKRNTSTIILSLMSLLILPFKAQALTFNVTFDDTFDNTLTEPFIGTGTFTFDGDPGDGIFALNSLSNFEFNFNFIDGLTYTTEDIITPIEEVLIVIDTEEDQRTVKFSNLNPFGSGESSGSIDFMNDSENVLSFEPPGFGGNLNLYQASEFGGTYNGIGVTEVASVPESNFTKSLLAIGALNIGLAFFRRKK